MEYFWNTLLTTDKATVFDLYLHGIYSYCIYRELEANLERSEVPVSIFLDQPSFHPCDASCAKNFARSYQCKHGMSFCKTSRSYTMSTRRLIVLGMHTWHLPMSMVVRVQSQTQQLPTCLRHNLIISIQDVMTNASTSLERKLLTCIDTIWPDVIHVGTIGMGLNSASVTKILLESTVMRMTVVMKICFPQNLAVLAGILSNHKTKILYVSFLPVSYPCVHFVDLFQKRHTHILRQTLYQTLHFCTFCIVILFSRSKLE